MYSVAYRFCLAGFLLLVGSKIAGLNLTFSLKQHKFILLQGALLFSFNYLLVYNSELYLTSGLVGLMFSLLVFFNILNSRIFLKTPFELKVIIGGMLGIVGTSLIFWKELMAFSFTDGRLTGMALAIGGTAVASLGNITSAYNQSKGIPVISSNAFGMAYGGILMLTLALLTGQPITFIFETSYIASLLYLAIFGSIIAFGTYLTLVGNIGASKAAYVNLIGPVIALALSTIFEDYQWTLTSFSGAALILIGNTIALRRKKRVQLALAGK